MTAELRRSLVLAGAGLLAGFALVLALFGAAEMAKRWSNPADAPAPVASLSPPTALPGGSIAPETNRSEEAGAAQSGKSRPDGEPVPEPSQTSPSAQTKAPTFDIIRVEPNGEFVIAGRGAPNTTVELLRDNAPIARVLIDPSGQFALVPPPLPPGNSEITLRITGPDGQVMLSKESVAVVISPNRETKPLIALSAPDRPTVVLSQPDPAPSSSVNAATADVSPGGKAKTKETAPSNGASTASKAKKTGQPQVKVVSVDAEEGGRLYVTGQATPGATVRLYLNDTLVAPGSAGPDGRLSFAIGRGVAPGDYRVRIDEIDAVSGKVKARSEVSFAMPVPKPANSGERETLAAQLKPPAAKSVAPKPSDSRMSEPKVLAPDALAALSPGQAATASLMGPRPPSAAPEMPMVAPAERVGTGNTKKPDLADGTIFIPEIGTAKIARGDNLWQISRRTYGKGTRYTVIFDANQGQIRNPDLIYPGQIFVLPSGGAAEGQDGRRG